MNLTIRAAANSTKNCPDTEGQWRMSKGELMQNACQRNCSTLAKLPMFYSSNRKVGERLQYLPCKTPKNTKPRLKNKSHCVKLCTF